MPTEDVLRTDTVEEVIGHLRAGRSVDVVGAPCSGHTTLLRQITTGLEHRGVSVTRIVGVGALRDQPLGALAVADVDMTSSSDALQTLASAVSGLEERLSATPAVLAIDDTHDLDAGTLGAIAAVHARLRTPVLTMSRSTAAPRPETDALRTQLQPGVRVELGPLRFDEVHRLVQGMLGGPVDPIAVARIAHASGGLPGLVAAIVDTARGAARLAPRGGVWVTRGDLWTVALSQRVAPFVAGLDDASREALTMLSFAGPSSLAAAMSVLGGADGLATLDDRGLLRVRPERGTTVVGVFPPVLAEHLRSEASITRRLLIDARLDAREAPEPIPSGLGVPADRFGTPGAGSLLNCLLTDHWHRELQNRRVAWESAESPDTAAPLLDALLVTRARPHEVDAVLDHADPPGAQPGEQTADRADDRAFLTAFGALHEGLVRGHADTARARLRRGIADGGPTGLLRAAEARLQLLTESVPDPDVLVPGAEDDARAADTLLAVRAEALVAGGRPRAALDLLDGFTSPWPAVAQHAEVTRELAELYTGDLRGAVGRALAGIERCRLALDPGGIQAHAYVAGLGLTLQGRLVELDELMVSVLALVTSPADQDHIQTGLLSLAADAARWQNRWDYARCLAAQTSPLGRPRGPHPGMAADAVALRVREGDDSAAGELWAIAEERLEHGFLPAGILVGVCAVERRPDPQWAARLLEAAQGCDSPLFTHLGAYAVAIASRDTDRLAELEPRLLQAGLRLYAVHAAVARSITMLSTGDVVGAAQHVESTWNEAGLRGRDLCGLFRRFDHAVALTPREREIAILVAKGLSTREIAAMKCLSVRTVEHHTFAACRKVGVDTREGLARTAQTWLSCATNAPPPLAPAPAARPAATPAA